MLTFITTFILFSIAANLLCYSGTGVVCRCFRLNALNGTTSLLPDRLLIRLRLPVKAGSA